MDIFETIGYIVGVLLTIFITVCIPIFIANYAHVAGIGWWGLVIVVSMMTYAIIAMISEPVSDVDEYVEVFVDSDGNVRDNEGNIIYKEVCIGREGNLRDGEGNIIGDDNDGDL